MHRGKKGRREDRGPDRPGRVTRKSLPDVNSRPSAFGARTRTPTRRVHTSHPNNVHPNKIAETGQGWGRKRYKMGVASVAALSFLIQSNLPTSQTSPSPKKLPTSLISAMSAAFISAVEARPLLSCDTTHLLIFDLPSETSHQLCPHPRIHNLRLRAQDARRQVCQALSVGVQLPERSRRPRSGREEPGRMELGES